MSRLGILYELPSILTKNSKVLMMQYKITHRLLAVNYNLKIWGKSETDLCKVCNQIENIEHVIYDCPKTLALRNTLQLWWKSVFHFTIMLSTLEIIFGIPNENNDNSINVYNYIILYTKYYIYTQQKNKKKICTCTTYSY